MSNLGDDNGPMPLQEFNLEDVSDGEGEVFEPFLDEPDNNFDQFTFKFNDALNETLAHENEDSEESEIESYMGEYEQEQDDNSNDKLNSEERDEIIPNDRFDTSGGSSSKKRDIKASLIWNMANRSRCSSTS
jgi:hypothetical protein